MSAKAPISWAEVMGVGQGRLPAAAEELRRPDAEAVEELEVEVRP